MIITLTINPAIDRNLLTDRLVFEDRAYILSSSDSAGGRGINASRVLHSFGVKTTAITTSGGKNGKLFEKLVAKAGFPVEFVPVSQEIRTNFTITDRQGLTIKLNELGPPMLSAEAKAVKKAVEQKLPGADWLMLCGSIPPGVNPDFYCELIEMANAKGVKTLLDTDGEVLMRGVEARPSIVTPNQQEAERLLSRALLTRAQFREAVSRIKQMGAQSVLLSLGSRGVVAADGHQMFEAVPPRVEALSPIGAGDALAAAFVWAATKKKNFCDCIRWGVAAGTASAALPGTDFATQAQIKDVYKSVEVTVINPN